MNKATGSIVSFGSRRGVSKTSGKQFSIHNVVLSDGQTYEVGFNPLKGYSVGDNISFMWELKFGQRQVQTATITGAGSSTSTGSSGYEDDTPATPVAPRPAASQKPSFGPQNRPFPVPKDHGDRSITRQNALTNARELYCSMFGGSTGNWDKAADEIIAMAYKFEEYTTGDRELNAAKAELGKAKKAKVVDIKPPAEPSVLEGLTGTDDEPF